MISHVVGQEDERASFPEGGAENLELVVVVVVVEMVLLRCVCVAREGGRAGGWVAGASGRSSTPRQRAKLRAAAAARSVTSG